MKDETHLEAEVVKWLDEIKPVPARDPQTARRARALFLNQAVSASVLPRRTGWTFKFRKEQFAMNALLTLFVLASLLFGGGVTVRAAQDDLPDQPLYALKTWSEDLSVQFENNEEAQVDRLLELAQTRTQEMIRLTEDGKTVPDRVQLRLEQHLQQALQICSTLDDPAMDRILLRLRDQLRDRDRDMEQLQLHANPDALPILERTRTMLQQRLQVVEDGLLNHEMFRNAARNGFQYGQQDDLTPPAPNQNGNGAQNGQPNPAPGGSNTDPGGPNTNPGGPNLTPGGPNTDPGGMNTTPGGPNTDPGGPNTEPGGNMNGSSGNNNDSGGNGSGGSNAGGGNQP